MCSGRNGEDFAVPRSADEPIRLLLPPGDTYPEALEEILQAIVDRGVEAGREVIEGIAYTRQSVEKRPSLSRRSQGEIFRRDHFREGDGILVDANSTDTELARNRSDQNADDGIDVRATDTELTRNSANRNTDIGIVAVDGVDDGGRNRASDNGGPEQCTGVSCS